MSKKDRTPRKNPYIDWVFIKTDSYRLIDGEYEEKELVTSKTRNGLSIVNWLWR